MFSREAIGIFEPSVPLALLGNLPLACLSGEGMVVVVVVVVVVNGDGGSGGDSP